MGRPTVDIGRVGVWYGMIDALGTPDARRCVARLDELGFGALWLAEAVGRDPFVMSAHLLAASERIVLATGIANVYARDPMTMHAAQQTLAEAYPGRFLLGLGVSHGHLVSAVRGHDWTKPYSYMREYLDRMDAALYLAPKPAPEPGRVLAALGPKMLRLAAERANGAHPYFVTPEHTRIARETMGPDALLAPEQMVVFATDPEEGRRIARTATHIYLGAPNYTNNLRRLGFDDGDFADAGSDRLVDAIVAWGDDDAIAERIAGHHAAGADHVCVQILTGGTPVPDEQFARLARIASDLA